MEDETKDEIRKYVRMAVHSGDEIVEIFCGEKYAKGELDQTEVEQVVAQGIEEHQRKQEAWPKEIDCDRLRQVFDRLNKIGILALENLGSSHSEGYHEVHERYDGLSDKSGIAGFCFYHQGDVESAVDEGTLLLSFGHIDPDKEEDEGLGIGKIILEELRARGFRVVWDGTWEERIALKKIDWK